MKIISMLPGPVVARLVFYWTMGFEAVIVGIILTVGSVIWDRFQTDHKIAADAKAEWDSRQAP
jgi:hypothetical protein